jgi:hypothetical protein
MDVGVLKACQEIQFHHRIAEAIVFFKLIGDGADWFEIMEEAEEPRSNTKWKGVLNFEHRTPSNAAEEALRSRNT